MNTFVHHLYFKNVSSRHRRAFDRDNVACKELCFPKLSQKGGLHSGWGYPHDGHADKDSYPHDGRADNAPYRHDRRGDKNPYRHDRNMGFSSKLSPELILHFHGYFTFLCFMAECSKLLHFNEPILRIKAFGKNVSDSSPWMKSLDWQDHCKCQFIKVCICLIISFVRF